MTIIIAEIGTNWHDLPSALDMIRIAAESGADLVKFQDWHPIKEMNRPDEWKEKCDRWTLPPEWHAKLRAKADEHNIGYLCSVFTKDAISRALSMDAMAISSDSTGSYHSSFPARLTAIKIASSEISNQALLFDLANRSPFLLKDDLPYPPIWLSLGEVEYQNQVHTAISRLAQYDVTLLACVAEYPVKRPLALLDSLIFAKTFGLPVGISSHVAYPDSTFVAKQAVKKGASVVEVHLRTEDTPKDCPDNEPHALYPKQFKKLVEAVKDVSG